MKATISFDKYKQAALFYDRVFPATLDGFRGTGNDLRFRIPEEISPVHDRPHEYGFFDELSSKEFINLVFDKNNIGTEKERISYLAEYMHAWEEFNKIVKSYKEEIGSLPHNEIIQKGYLENIHTRERGLFRNYFRNFAKVNGAAEFDVILPSSVVASEVQKETPVLQLTGLNLIDTKNASWAQIIEIRTDIESRKKLKRLRAFLVTDYSNKTSSFIEDSIATIIEDYDIARKKHGFDIVTSSLSILLDSKNIQSSAAAGIGAAFLGGPLVGLTTVAVIELGHFSIEFSKRRRNMVDWEKSHPAAYLIDVKNTIS